MSFIWLCDLRSPESLYVNGVCHAASDDLIRWQELPSAVVADALGQPGDMDPWSGCCVARETEEEDVRQAGMIVDRI